MIIERLWPFGRNVNLKLFFGKDELKRPELEQTKYQKQNH
jgi:hypothetical protein